MHETTIRCDHSENGRYCRRRTFPGASDIHRWAIAQPVLVRGSWSGELVEVKKDYCPDHKAR